MDLLAMGKFLSQLRREQGLTQEQLGEKLGVTNKTVSRWETGCYMPPVDILQELSALYGITINEILSGKRADETSYQQIAEENIKEALNTGFSLKEKIAFFKNKWKRDHRASLIVAVTCFAMLYILGWNDDNQMLNLVVTLSACFFALCRYNAMMCYVEQRAFDPVHSEDRVDNGVTKEHIKWSRVRITGFMILALCIWICADLGGNLLYSLVPELNDGITIHGFWAKLFFGMDGTYWSREGFYDGFIYSVNVLTAVGIGNLFLSCLDRIKQMQ